MKQCDPSSVRAIPDCLRDKPLKRAKFYTSQHGVESWLTLADIHHQKAMNSTVTVVKELIKKINLIEQMNPK